MRSAIVVSVIVFVLISTFSAPVLDIIESKSPCADDFEPNILTDRNSCGKRVDNLFPQFPLLAGRTTFRDHGLLAEVALQQAGERLAVTGLVAGHLIKTCAKAWFCVQLSTTYLQL